MLSPERYHDECARCKAAIYVHLSGPFTESFCATCRIADALEQLVEIADEATQFWGDRA